MIELDPSSLRSRDGEVKRRMMHGTTLSKAHHSPDDFEEFVERVTRKCRAELRRTAPVYFPDGGTGGGDSRLGSGDDPNRNGGLPITVVDMPSLGVGENLIGFPNPPKQLRIARAGSVRMAGLHPVPISFEDLARGRLTGHAEEGVVIFHVVPGADCRADQFALAGSPSCLR